MIDSAEKTSEQENSTELIEQQMNLVRYKRALSRRTFLERVGIASVAVVGASALNGCLSSMAVAANPSQADVLNFALNLEFLEAEFYTMATSGTTLTAAQYGTATGATTGGNQVNFGGNSTLANIAAEIAADEQAHVAYLRTALGSTAVAKPAINLSALGIGFGSPVEFITLARAFEDTGVSAYGGAAPLLSGDPLAAAARILATEAYHAGNLRLEAVMNGVNGPMLDSLDQPPAPNRFFVTDQNGLAVVRTPSQVLAIVYANSKAGTSSGGFFPMGVNGAIKTV